VVVINQVNTERQHMYQAFTKRRGLATMGIFAASALVLAGCASETESASTDTDSGSSSGVVELNLATVNNPQMVDMESLKGEFEAAYPDIKVNFIVMEEGDLRDSVTKDIASGGGQYDILTIGAYEVPIWGANGWLADLTDLAG
jgi:sorbitol/mannitol transport system substrate-binding protein